MAKKVNLLVTDGMEQRGTFNDDIILELQDPNAPVAVQLRALRPSAMPANCRSFAFTTPIAKVVGVNGIVSTGLAANSSTMTCTIAAQPDMARNVRIKGGSGWDGGNVTVAGLDEAGNAASETFLQADIANKTAVGHQPFSSITSITKSAVGASSATILVDVGDALGVPQQMIDAVGMAFITGVYDAPTLNVTYNTYTPTTVPDGSKSYVLIANV